MNREVKDLVVVLEKYLNPIPLPPPFVFVLLQPISSLTGTNRHRDNEDWRFKRHSRVSKEKVEKEKRRKEKKKKKKTMKEMRRCAL